MRRQRNSASLVQLFRLLGDANRLRIVRILSEGEHNVTELTRRLKLAQPTVSRHLAMLRYSNLATAHRRGKQVFYRLDGLLAVRHRALLRAILRSAR